MKINLKKDNYVVFDKTETLKSNIIRQACTGLMLAFCVYVSRGSTWWTFVSGLLFLSWLCGMAYKWADARETKFGSWTEFKAWVDRQAAAEAQEATHE